MSYMRDSAGRRLDSFKAITFEQGFAAPLPQRPPRPQVSTVTRFESGHGWSTASSTAALNLNDTSKQGLAEQVVTFTTLPGTIVSLDSPTIAVPVDPSGKTFELLLSIDAPSKVSEIQVYMGATGVTNSDIYRPIPASIAGRQMDAGEMFSLIFGAAGKTTSGTGLVPPAARFRIRVTPVAGETVTISLGGLRYYTTPTAAANGGLVVSFDDSYASARTKALWIMNQYGYRGTLYPIVGRVGGAGRLTLDQIRELNRLYNWEVGGHAMSSDTHAIGNENMTSDELDAEFSAMRAYWATNGIAIETHAWPGGGQNAQARDIARRYFVAARTTLTVRDKWPISDSMRVGNILVKGSTTASSITAAMDLAKATGQLLTLTIHDIVTSVSGADAYEITATYFATVIAYAASIGLPGYTMSEAARLA